MEKLLKKGVAISLHPSQQRQDRILIASQQYQPGELVYSESTLLHSAHPHTRQYRPLANSLATDWQRLIFVWSVLLNDPMCRNLLDSLSTDGCTSAVAREQEPKRLGMYKTNSLQLKKHFKKFSKQMKNGGPADYELERMMHILETNCLSTDMLDDVLDSMQEGLNEDDEDDEELVGIWPLTSMMEHSCFPNCTFNIRLEESQAVIDIRAVCPIRIGEMLTISYNDKEFYPTPERRQLLLARGFECHCDLCDGRIEDYSNMYLGADMELRPNYSAQLSEDELHDISKCVLQNFLQLFSDLLLSRNMDSTFFKANLELDLIRETTKRMKAQQVNYESIINHQIYGFLKSILYSDLGLFSIFFKDIPAWLAGIWLVCTNVVLMKRVKLVYSEDLKHNLFWSIQTLQEGIDQCNDDDRNEVMSNILNQFTDKLQEQELVLQ